MEKIYIYIHFKYEPLLGKMFLKYFSASVQKLHENAQRNEGVEKCD